MEVVVLLHVIENALVYYIPNILWCALNRRTIQGLVPVSSALGC